MAMVLRTAATSFDNELVAAVIIAEAGDESRIGMEAVREVIWNRATNKHITERRVVLAPKQFSCLNNTTENALITKSRKHKHWLIAIQMAARPPKTNHAKGANHYLNPDAVHRIPMWAKKSKRVAIIGRHHFYKL